MKAARHADHLQEVRCVIFDLDGTLVDSEPASSRAFLDLLPDLDDDEDAMVARYRGRPMAFVLADIKQRLKRSLPADFEALYRSRVNDLFATQLKPMPGAADMLSALRLPRGIASSGPMAKIRRSLALTGLDRFFGTRLYSSYDTNSWKPEPGLFLHAAERMGFAPEACLVVEDSDVGISAALAAGMKAARYDPSGRSAAAENVTTIDTLPALLALLRT